MFVSLSYPVQIIFNFRCKFVIHNIRKVGHQKIIHSYSQSRRLEFLIRFIHILTVLDSS